MKISLSVILGIFKSYFPLTTIINLGYNISHNHTLHYCYIDTLSKASWHIALRSWCFKLTLWHCYSSDRATEMCVATLSFNKGKMWKVKFLLERANSTQVFRCDVVWNSCECWSVWFLEEKKQPNNKKNPKNKLTKFCVSYIESPTSTDDVMKVI